MTARPRSRTDNRSGGRVTWLAEVIRPAPGGDADDEVLTRDYIDIGPEP